MPRQQQDAIALQQPSLRKDVIEDNYLQVLEEKDGEFQPRIQDLPGIFNQTPIDSLSPTSQKCVARRTVIFADAESIKELVPEGTVPDAFWPMVSDDLNGTFGVHHHDKETKETVVAYDSWSCFKIKHVCYDSSSISYRWVQCAVFVRHQWEDDSQIVVFLNCPVKVRSQLRFLFPSVLRGNPYGWHAIFLVAVKQEYNSSIWGIRDLVRDVELKRKDTWPRNIHSHDNSDFLRLHEIGRHVIHSNETLEVAKETMETIMHEHANWHEEDCEIHNDKRQERVVGRLRQRVFRDVQQRLSHTSKDIRALKFRSVSLNERLQNEINLAFNIVAQHNNKLSIEIAQSARADNETMKTLALVGMVYLPGTFISGIFGMNFFNFNPNNNDPEVPDWNISGKFWMYWVITVPLTITTMLAWATWHHPARIRKMLQLIRIGSLRERKNIDHTEERGWRSKTFDNYPA